MDHVVIPAENFWSITLYEMENSQTPGKGAKCGMAFVDSEGNPITGDNNFLGGFVARAERGERLPVGEPRSPCQDSARNSQA